MMRFLIIMILFGFCFGFAQDFEYDACPFSLPEGEQEDKTIRCGFLYVPETRGDAESFEIEIAVAILHSRQQPALADPIIYLEGGPGGSALAAVEDWAESSLRETRDLILFDQRGTGYSFPVLNCDELSLDEFEDEDEASLACLERLKEEGIATDSYNSRENAADIADLQKALGLEQVNLYGISYGTRLALTVMRDQPQGIRSVVLDSSYPPNVEGIAEGPMHMQRAFDQLFKECREDAACAAAYPNLETDFYAMLERLNETPYELEEGLELTAADYADSLFQSLYDSRLIPALPFAISLATQGNLDDSYALMTGELSVEDIGANEQPLSVLWQLLVGVFASERTTIDDAEGMYNSVECYEDAPFQTAQMVNDLSQNVHPSLKQEQVESAISQLELCNLWSSQTAAKIENEAVISDIPTLILAGSLDPVTPPVWGQIAAEGLINSTFIEFPGMGHGLIDLHDCPTSLVTEFLLNPSAPLDISCSKQMKADFFVPRQ